MPGVSELGSGQFEKMAAAKGSQDVEIAPLRSLDDYLMESARFQIPNLKDADKWANRVMNNLLYYQTNYFLTSLLAFLLVGVMHPVKMFYGFLALAVAFGLFYYVTNERRTAQRFKRDHPFVSVIIIVTGGYFIVYMLGSVVVFLTGILLPFVGKYPSAVSETKVT